MSTVTAAAAEITDSRIEVIGFARDVLERAKTEAGSAPPNPVIWAMADLRGALRNWVASVGQEEKDVAVRLCGLRALQLLNVIGDVMGPESAAFAAGADSSDEEGSVA